MVEETSVVVSEVEVVDEKVKVTVVVGVSEVVVLSVVVVAICKMWNHWRK